MNFKSYKTFIPLFAAASILTACETEPETPGVSRMEIGSPQHATAQVSLEPVSGAGTGDPHAIPKHAAPPLDQLVGNTPDPHASAGTAVDGQDMVIQAGETEVLAGGNILQVAGLALTVNEDWENVKTANPIRVAEYKINGSAGPAEMAVFYFGQNQGGGMEDNIRRWAGQFTNPADPNAGAQVARIERDNLRIALVKSEGTYNPGSMGPMAPAPEPKDNYALFGLVVEGGPEGSLFIRITGPKETMAENDEDFSTMAQSVRISGYQ